MNNKVNQFRAMELTDKLLNMPAAEVVDYYKANQDDKAIKANLQLAWTNGSPAGNLANYYWEWASVAAENEKNGSRTVEFRQWLTAGQGKDSIFGYYNERNYLNGKEQIAQLVDELDKAYKNEYEWYDNKGKYLEIGRKLEEVADKSFDLYLADVEDEKKRNIARLLMNAQETAQCKDGVYVISAGSNAIGWFNKLSTRLNKEAK